MGLTVVPLEQASVVRDLGHYLSPTAGNYGDPVTPAVVVPSRAEAPPAWRPLIYEGALLPQGLFDSRHPLKEVWCPTVYHKDAFVCRRLSLGERLRLHQVPEGLDDAIRAAGYMDPSGPLVFEWAPPAHMFVSIVR